MSLPTTPPAEVNSGLEKFIQRTKGQFTLSDASAALGTPMLETEEAVRVMMERYHSRLKVTEGGDLLYDFGRTPTRRDAVSWAERWAKIKDALWRGFKVFYKACIAVVLVVYFVIFVLLLIALLVGASSSNKDDKDGDRGSSNGGGMFALIGQLLRGIFSFGGGGSQTVVYDYDDRGYRHKRYEPTPPIFPNLGGKNKKETAGGKPRKSFFASVYDFVFGPDRVPENPLAQFQEFAAFARDRKGIIATSDIQALTGWSREKSEDQLTAALAAFNGKAEISLNATLYGNFSDLLRSTKTAEGGKYIYYWDEYEAPHLLTGNKKWTNVGIIALNSFNLIMSAAIIIGIIDGELKSDPVATSILGIFPFVFSFLFFLIPLLRMSGVKARNHHHREANIRRRMMKLVVIDGLTTFTRTKMLEALNQGADREEKLSLTDIESPLLTLVEDFEGERDADDNGEVVYRLSRLSREMNDIAEVRQEQRNNNRLGNIVFEA